MDKDVSLVVLEKQNAAQKGLLMMMEDPDLLEVCAQNLYKNQRTLGTYEFHELSEKGRQVWRNKALVGLEQMFEMVDEIAAALEADQEDE